MNSRSLGSFKPHVENTYNAKGGRDQAFTSVGSQMDEFTELYYWLYDNIKALKSITNDQIFESELKKIKKPTKRIIEKFFRPALLNLETSIDYKDQVDSFKNELNIIFNHLGLKQA